MERVCQSPLWLFWLPGLLSMRYFSNDPHILPSLIQYYPGFEAYSRIVQVPRVNTQWTVRIIGTEIQFMDKFLLILVLIFFMKLQMKTFSPYVEF